VTLERRTGGAAGAIEIYEGALRDLDLNDHDVDQYLAENRAKVEAALAARKGRGGTT
jgi:hypothetical protein